MNYWLLYIKNFFLIPIILLFLIIRIFKKFKINKIPSHSIGEMSYAIEIYIHEKKIDPKKTTAIWFMGKLVSNKFLAKKWSEQMLILPRHILEPIYFFFNNFKIFSFFIFNYDEESDAVKRTLKDKLKRIDNKNVLLKYGPSIKFNSFEKNKGNLYLKKAGLDNKKFFTFALRSAGYKNEKFETSRNSNISNIIPGLKSMTSKNYKAIRLGKNEKKKLDFNDPNIIDYATSPDRSDFLDVYLISKSDFMISSNTGINEVAVLFRKPRLIIDFFDIPSLEHHFLKVMIIPKKYINLKTGDLVSFEEAFKKKLNHIHIIPKMNDLGYSLIDNDELEINQSVENFHKFINNTLDLNEILQNQKIFWNNIEKYFGFKNKNIIVCPNFYNKNIKLFD